MVHCSCCIGARKRSDVRGGSARRRRWGQPCRLIPSKDVSPIERGSCAVENLTLNDFISLTLMLIAFATLVLKLYDSKKH